MGLFWKHKLITSIVFRMSVSEKKTFSMVFEAEFEERISPAIKKLYTDISYYIKNLSQIILLIHCILVEKPPDLLE